MNYYLNRPFDFKKNAINITLISHSEMDIYVLDVHVSLCLHLFLQRSLNLELNKDQLDLRKDLLG